MKQLLTQQRIAILHDFDGPHCNHLLIDEYEAFFDQIKAEAAMHLFPDLCHEEAARMSRESSQIYHYGLEPFLGLAKKAGLDEEAFIALFHATYHQFTYKKISEEHPHLLEPCSKTLAAFRSLQGIVRHGLLTQGCFKNWTGPALTHQKTLEFFDPNCLLDHMGLGRRTKAKSPEPIRIGMQRLGVKAHQTIFLEDSLRNLQIAKEAEPEILTVYIHQRAARLPKLPDYVDFQVRDVYTLLKRVHALHVLQKPKPSFNPVPA